MTATPKRPAAAWRTDAAREDESADTGPFILTLCRLAAPIAIPQPRAAHLKGLTFFISRSRTPGGGQHWLLHAGYFATAASALECLERLRGLYPTATAHTAPAALLKEYGAGIPTLKPAAAPAPSASSILTDTQVLQILEQRRTESIASRAEPAHGYSIPTRRPDDTQTQRALKQAVHQNAPVAFAVQLLWSVQPINLDQVPSLPIFRAYTLYRVEGRRDGRSWYCLRLGFFKDALSAKHVAYFVRSSFVSVAVVPVSEQERMRAKPERMPASAAVERERALPPPAPAAESPKPHQAAAQPKNTTPTPLSSQRSKPKRPSARSIEETLEQTLEQLASEVWTDEGSPTDTGVRHLNVTVTKRGSRRT